MARNAAGLDDYKRRLEIEQDQFQLIDPELAGYILFCGLILCMVLFR